MVTGYNWQNDCHNHEYVSDDVRQNFIGAAKVSPLVEWSWLLALPQMNGSLLILNEQLINMAT